MKGGVNHDCVINDCQLDSTQQRYTIQIARTMLSLGYGVTTTGVVVVYARVKYRFPLARTKMNEYWDVGMWLYRYLFGDDVDRFRFLF